jgi:hypothetical protein
LALAGCDPAEKDMPPEAPAPADMKVCTEDSQCVLVDNSCNGCCQRDAVNRKDSLAFIQYKPSICRGRTGAVCDCCYHPAKAACVNQRCQVRVLAEGCSG